MAFTCSIKTHSAGLLGKEFAAGPLVQRFIARRDAKILINLKTAAVKAIMKHDIEGALEKSCEFLEEQYNTLFNVLLLAKRSIDDAIHFVELRGVASRQILGYSEALVKEMIALAKDGQEYGNSLAEMTRGKRGVALSFSSKFFVNINEIQRFALRREIKTAFRYELQAEKLESANKLDEYEILGALENKIKEMQQLRKALKTIMIETRLFIEKVDDAVEQYNLPRGDVETILKSATDMFENELLCFNQLAKLATALQRSVKTVQAKTLDLRAGNLVLSRE